MFGTCSLTAVAIPLCAACGSWTKSTSHPVLFSIVWGIVAVNVFCMLAAMCWLLKGPGRLYAAPSVKLTALLAACTSTTVAHQAWLLGCRTPHWGIILLLAAVPFLAGRWQRWLSCGASCTRRWLTRPRPPPLRLL